MLLKTIAVAIVLVARSIICSKLSEDCAAFAPRSYYLGASCYIASATTKTYTNAKTQCNDITGGHLAFIHTETELNAALEKMSQFSITNMYVGLERQPTGQWAWTLPSGELFVVPTQQPQIILWGGTEPSGVSGEVTGRIFTTGTLFGLGDISPTNNYHYLCEYEEPRKRAFRRVAQNALLPNSTHIANLNGHVFACARACRAATVCRSYSYNEETNDCIIQWTDGSITGFEPIQAQGYDLFMYIY